MKKLFAILLLSTSATAGSLNLQLPSSQPNFATDRVKGPDIDCSNAIGSATQAEFGVTGVTDNENLSLDTGQPLKDIGVYARIVIPIGGPTERVDCNRLYELELRRRELEIRRLELEIEMLQDPGKMEFK